MRKVQTVLYTYDELTDPARERARDWYRSMPDDHWHADVLDDAKKMLGFLGFADMDIQFSGFYCQGDGASFTAVWCGDSVDEEALKEYAPQDETLHSLATPLKRIADSSEEGKGQVSLSRISHHYVHQHTIGFEFEGVREADEEEFKEAARKAMRWVYAQLRAQYEYESSDEAVEENIIANGYEFYADGRRVRDADFTTVPKEALKVRDRLSELDELVTLALPYVEEAADDPVNKKPVVTALAQRMRAAIAEC